MESIDCRDCANAGCDPDGLYCGAPFSLAASQGYGLNLQRAREGECGQAALFFARASDDVLKARGRA